MKLTGLLDEIQRLDQEATKGPWIYADNALGEVLYHQRNELGGYGGSATVVELAAEDDGEFIALARTALPKLAKVVRTVMDSCEETIRGVDNQYSPDDRDHGKRYHADMILDHIHDAMEADDD